MKLAVKLRKGGPAHAVEEPSLGAQHNLVACKLVLSSGLSTCDSAMGPFGMLYRILPYEHGHFKIAVEHAQCP